MAKQGKLVFIPEGATWWGGGHCIHRGVKRVHRYVTGGNGRKFESCPYSDGWYARGDTLDSDGQPYRYAVKPEVALQLTQLCIDTPETRPDFSRLGKGGK